MRLVPPAVLLAIALAACADVGTSTGDDAAGRVAHEGAQEVTYAADGGPEGLQRYLRWSDRIAQGAQPIGDAAFRNLAALGFTTVLSVDGARPDVAAAEAHGLRYVHVPIGYDGLDERDALRIVKGVETSTGPVYVHCHHGRHRGSAAAVIARIALEGVSNEQAVEDLRSAGCDPVYTGLYRDVGAFRHDPAALAAVPADLPAVVEPEDLLGVMLELDVRVGNLAAVRDAGWRAPPENPDIDPPHEALMAREALREGARLDAARAAGDDFLALMSGAENTAAALEEALRGSDAGSKQAAYAALRETCDTCHSAFRN